MVPSKTVHSSLLRRTMGPRLLARSGARAAICLRRGTSTLSVPAAAPAMRLSRVWSARSGPGRGGRPLKPGGNIAAAAGPRPPRVGDRAAALAVAAPPGARLLSVGHTPAVGGRVTVDPALTLAAVLDHHPGGETRDPTETDPGRDLIRAVGARAPATGAQVIAGVRIVATTPARVVE